MSLFYLEYAVLAIVILYVACKLIRNELVEGNTERNSSSLNQKSHPNY